MALLAARLDQTMRPPRLCVAVFTKSLALEVVKNGINVNAIAPGRVATERVRGRYSNEEWATRVAAIPLGRAATPEEIAPTALFPGPGREQIHHGPDRSCERCMAQLV